MKMARLTGALLCVVISVALWGPAARAVAVDMHCGDALEGEYVTDIVEGDGVLYFLVSVGQGKIVSTDIAAPGQTVTYSPELAGAAEMGFIDMEVAATGELWTLLGDGSHNRVAVFRSGELVGAYDCPARPWIAGGIAVWEQEGAIYCWDGAQAAAYPIPADCPVVGDVAASGGRPVFVDWPGGKVLRFLEDGQTEAVFALPDGQGFSHASLEACGEELYFSYWAGDEAGLIRLSDGAKLSDGAYNIHQGRMQADGQGQLIMTVRPKISVPFTNVTDYVQGTVGPEGYTQRTVQTYLTKAEYGDPEVDEDGLPAGYHYTDSAGDLWIYHQRASGERGAVTKVTPDGTVIRYSPADPEKKCMIYWNTMGVSFDAEPYIAGAGYMMVPVRGISALLGASVHWDGETKTVSMSKGDRTIALKIGSSTAIVDGQEVPLDAAAEIVNGRTMVPLRFLTEALDGEVSWTDGAAHIAFH